MHYHEKFKMGYEYDLIIQLDTEIRNMQMAGECLYEIQRMKQEFKWAQKL